MSIRIDIWNTFNQKINTIILSEDKAIDYIKVHTRDWDDDLINDMLVNSSLFLDGNSNLYETIKLK